jgi:polar amino acid transport system permease protein
MHDVLRIFFSPHDFRDALPNIWAGFQVNLKLMVVAEALVLVFALAIAVVRGLPGRGAKPFRALAIVYTDFFRGTPLILVAYVCGLGLPALHIAVVSDQSLFTYGIVALTVVYTAYVTEVYRAGIESVHPSQRSAARSLGLTHRQTMRLVVLPQALRTVTPALLNDFVALQKDVGLISVLGAIDAVRSAQIIVGQTFNFTPYIVAGLLFVLLAVPSARLADAVSARARRRQQSGSLL